MNEKGVFGKSYSLCVNLGGDSNCTWRNPTLHVCFNKVNNGPTYNVVSE
jgi:hypothetical protein